MLYISNTISPSLRRCTTNRTSMPTCSAASTRLQKSNISRRSPTLRRGPEKPTTASTSGQRSAARASKETETPASDGRLFPLRCRAHQNDQAGGRCEQPPARYCEQALVSALGTGTAGDDIRVQRDRAVPSQRPAFQIHAGGDRDRCQRQDLSLEYRVRSQGR